MNFLERKDKIIKFYELNNVLFSSFENVYIFGSILKSDIFNDIDLLLIYKKWDKKILNDKQNIMNFCENCFNFYADITLFSLKEFEETNFLKEIDDVFIKLK